MKKPTNPGKLSTLMCYNVYALHHAFGRFYQAAFADTGFTYPKFIILLALDESGPISLGDLSNKIGLEANSLSPLVKKMSAFGIIERVRDPQDERRVLLSLLPYGKTVLEEAQRVVDAGWSALDLPDGAVQDTIETLTKTRQMLERTSPPITLKIPDRDLDEDVR